MFTNIGTGTLTLSGIISGTGTLSQDGSGTTSISGTSNTGPGVVNVFQGTLQVNGSLPAGTTVNVSSGALLDGTGTIHGNVTTAGTGQIDIGGTIGGTLGAAGGNWTGVGTVDGLVTVSSGTFTIGGTLTAPAGVDVTGGTISAPGFLAGSLAAPAARAALLPGPSPARVRR